MSLMLRCCALMLLSVFALGGCAFRLGGRDFADPSWTAAKGRAGRVLLLVTGRPDDAMAPDHIEEVTTIASKVLAGLPETTVLTPVAPASTAPATAPGQWAANLSDTQAIEAAKAQGADSVCVLTVGYYSGMFSIGFMPLPGWHGSTSILYNLRLLDVRTGALLAHAVTYSFTGGQYQVRTHDDLRHDLDAALRWDLTPKETH